MFHEIYFLKRFDQLYRSNSQRALIVNTAYTRPVNLFLDQMKESGGLRGTDIANFTGVSKATVSRWVNGHISPRPATQLIISDLAYVIMRLGEYYRQEQVRAWLYAPHPQLEGKRAIDLIRNKRTEEVIAILDRLDADAYI